MSTLPLDERRFPLRLAPDVVDTYARTAHWLRHLLDRLGREPTLRVWHHAVGDSDDPLLHEILSAGWEPDEGEAPDVAAQLEESLRAQFDPPVEGIGVEDARKILDGTPPFPQLRRAFPSPHQVRQTTTYEGLHLFRDGLSRVAEALLTLYGKQGELIAYDALLYGVVARARPRMSPDEFLAQFSALPEKPTRFTAGLDAEIVRASDREVVCYVHACEWARYFQAHHPAVGYLMACSLDEAEYRAVHPTIRMQRTTTLMEGGDRCDFRIYLIN